ncbi:MAG: winged helix-turn-helix transcriptional regulator [Nitrososphaerota archaeon]|nr:winged helix-turn-helix transcriptional regulator [Candidatus Bathyarchaeota archaeon]MDW8193533.1 winged helix-turn-helix transcriptional regulator [Nitrososphaerota archaeon]
MGKAKKSQSSDILRSKGELTKFMILVEVMKNQPHVKQKEIGEAIGVTVQAVSKYFKKLMKEGLLEPGISRAQYRLTPKAHKKLEEYLTGLESYVRGLKRELKFERVWPAIASYKIMAGEKVNLEMRDGVLYAVPFKEGAETASGIAISNADPGEDVGLTDLKGRIRMETGKILVIKLPSINDGGSRAVNIEMIKELYNEFKPHRIGVMGTVGRAVLNKLELKADIEFGISRATALAALRGLRVLVLVVGRMVSRIINEIELTNMKYNTSIPYEIREAHIK